MKFGVNFKRQLSLCLHIGLRNVNYVGSREPQEFLPYQERATHSGIKLTKFSSTTFSLFGDKSVSPLLWVYYYRIHTEISVSQTHRAFGS